MRTGESISLWVAKDAKKLEKLSEYESKQGVVICAEDLMLLDAHDLIHDAGTCMSLRPSVDSHRNTRGSERHKDVWGFCKTSDFMTLPQMKKKTGNYHESILFIDETRAIPNTARDLGSFRACDGLPSCFAQRLFNSELRASNTPVVRKIQLNKKLP